MNRANCSPEDIREYRRKRHHHKRDDSESASGEDVDSNKRRHHKHKHKKDKPRQRSRSLEDRRDGLASDAYRNVESSTDTSNSYRRYHDRHSHHDRNRERSNPRPEGASAEYDPNMRIKQEKDERNLGEQRRERYNEDRRRRDHRRERDRAGGDHGLNTSPVRVKTEPGAEVGVDHAGGGKENAEAEKQKPNFELSGKLTEDTNTFRGVVIKYNEPPEAMKPKRRWRLYPFKGQESLPVLHIHRQSAFLLGRDRRIADIPVDHPSCSKQQAVLQFRAMPYERPDGTPGRRVRPYIIDLESANGTYLNGEKMEAKRYYELKEKDVVKFGFSSREYVVLHDSVDTSEVADGMDMEEA